MASYHISHVSRLSDGCRSWTELETSWGRGFRGFFGFVETLSGRTNHLRIIHISRRTRRTTSPLGRSLRSRRLRAAKNAKYGWVLTVSFASSRLRTYRCLNSGPSARRSSHQPVLELRPISPSFFSPTGAHAPDIPSIALHTFGVRTPFPSGKSHFA